MRIAVAVPYVDRARSYGGPITVAQHHVRELSKRHDLTVLVPTKPGDEDFCRGLFDAEVVARPAYRSRRLGMTSVFSPGLIAAGRSVVADVAQVHLARDLTMPLLARVLARRCDVVTQTHGMVVGGSLARRGLERVLTTGVLRSARTALYLTDEERDALHVVAPSTDLRFLANGVDLDELEAVVPAPRSDRLRLVYASRLTARKRPEIMLDLLEAALGAGLDAEVVMAGPDDGCAAGIAERADRLRVSDRFRYEGPLPREAALALMRSADLVALPSRHEPFPMAALESMGLGVPTAITVECGIAPHLDGDGRALVLPVGGEEFTASCVAVLGDRHRLRQIGEAQRATVAAQFTIHAVAARLEKLLQA
jgi:glycosyltransferase involved in cell wall biosynthesis